MRPVAIVVVHIGIAWDEALLIDHPGFAVAIVQILLFAGPDAAVDNRHADTRAIVRKRRRTAGGIHDGHPAVVCRAAERSRLYRPVWRNEFHVRIVGQPFDLVGWDQVRFGPYKVQVAAQNAAPPQYSPMRLGGSAAPKLHDDVDGARRRGVAASQVLRQLMPWRGFGGCAGPEHQGARQGCKQDCVFQLHYELL